MDDYICIGKIVNTHGIKGELKIISDFQKKNIVFKPGFKLYIGQNKISEEIVAYRAHKSFDMVTFPNYSNINEVLKYKGMEVFIDRNDLNLKENEYLLEDLRHCFVKENDKIIGKITDIVYNNANILLYVKGIDNFYIPYKGDYITKVNIQEKEIEVKNIKELII